MSQFGPKDHTDNIFFPIELLHPTISERGLWGTTKETASGRRSTTYLVDNTATDSDLNEIH